MWQHKIKIYDVTLCNELAYGKRWEALHDGNTVNTGPSFSSGADHRSCTGGARITAEGGSLKRDLKAGSVCMYVCMCVCTSVRYSILTSHRKKTFFCKAHARKRAQNGEPKKAIYGANKAFFY